VIGRWIVVLAAAIGASAGANLLGLPSPALFGGLAVGLVVALTAGWRLEPPRVSVVGAQAALGVALGALVQSSTLSEVGRHAGPIVGVSLATLALTVAAGLVLARWTGLDRPTAAFGMIAGGASGIVAIADELGADNRLVAVMQYLRVLVIVVLTPLVADVAFSAGPGGGGALDDGGPELGGQLLNLVLCVAAGLALARAIRLPAGSLLGPMIVAGALALADVPFAGPPPTVVQDAAFLVIGLEVGLRFTPESLRTAGRILLPSLALLAALLVACALLGLLLSELTGVSRLDGYLATTPGGLYAVIAAAVGTGSDTTFVLAVQVLRLFVMLLAAPLVARRLRPA
jgi:membrane AbrB-like protein